MPYFNDEYTYIIAESVIDSAFHKAWAVSLPKEDFSTALCLQVHQRERAKIPSYIKKMKRTTEKKLIYENKLVYEICFYNLAAVKLINRVYPNKSNTFVQEFFKCLVEELVLTNVIQRADYRKFISCIQKISPLIQLHV